MPTYPGTFRRRDAALARREVEGATQRQARAGGRRRQLSGRYSVRCRDREWPRGALDAPHLLFLPEDGVRQADRRVHRLHRPSAAAAQIDAAPLSLGHADRGRPASPLWIGAARPRTVRGASDGLQHLSRSPHSRADHREARASSGSTASASCSPTGHPRRSTSSSRPRASRPSFPFMDPSYILDEQGRSKLFIHTFHRELDDFFVVGLFEPAEGGVWQIADYQARLIAAFIRACESDPKRAAWFRALKAHAHARYRPRHPLAGYASGTDSRSSTIASADT